MQQFSILSLNWNLPVLFNLFLDSETVEMRQLFLVLLFDLVVHFTSAGTKIPISIPGVKSDSLEFDYIYSGILDSFLSGLHSAADESETTPSNNHPPSEDQTALALSNNKKWHTNSSSFYLPTEDGGQLRVGK